LLLCGLGESWKLVFSRNMQNSFANNLVLLFFSYYQSKENENWDNYPIIVLHLYLNYFEFQDFILGFLEFQLMLLYTEFDTSSILASHGHRKCEELLVLM